MQRSVGESGSAPSTWFCGVDIGGTFTDLVLVVPQFGEVYTEKVLSTPNDPSQAVVTGLKALADRTNGARSAAGTVVHATTLTSNALIERKGARTGLLTTDGFLDVLDIRRQNRYDIFDLLLEFPEPLVPIQLRWGVEERIGPDGGELKPVDTATIGAIAEAIQSEQVESIAIGFLNSYLDPSHEQTAAEALRAAGVKGYISLSSEVAPEIGEFERFSTCVVNAYTRPVIDRYLTYLESAVVDLWPNASVTMMVSNGGICALESARQVPARLIESGPVAGAMVGAYYGRFLGSNDILAFDMGGTTAKLCVVREGVPEMVAQFEAARVSRFRKGSGTPILSPSVDLVEIGAGGGSIASIDELGMLVVGPRSAGAEPGPACYGRGGTEATVTDADLALGYLNPNFFLGGRMPLQKQAALAAVDRIANDLGITGERAAWGIHDLVNENMATGARLHIAEKGLDARSFTLVATGGAGPVHACHLASKLGISHVVCPPAAGVASACGLIVAPPRADVAHSFLSPLATADWSKLDRLLNELEHQVRELLAKAAVRDSDIEVTRLAKMRYQGQTHAIEVPIPPGSLSRAADTLYTGFQEDYERLYGNHLADAAVELVGVRVAAAGPPPAFDPTVFAGLMATSDMDGGNTSSSTDRRRAYVASLGRSEAVPVFRRGDLIARQRTPIRGPALIEDVESTIVVDAGWRLVADTIGAIHLEREE